MTATQRKIGVSHLLLHLLVVFDLKSLQLLGELGDQALILLIQDRLMVLHLHPTLLLQLRHTGQVRSRGETGLIQVNLMVLHLHPTLLQLRDTERQTLSRTFPLDTRPPAETQIPDQGRSGSYKICDGMSGSGNARSPQIRPVRGHAEYVTLLRSDVNVIARCEVGEAAL